MDEEKHDFYDDRYDLDWDFPDPDYEDYMTPAQEKASNERWKQYAEAQYWNVRRTSFRCDKHNRPFYRGAPEVTEELVGKRIVQSIGYPNARCVKCDEEGTHDYAKRLRSVS